MKKVFLFFALMSAAIISAAPVTGTSKDNMEGQGNPFTNGYNYSFDADKGEVTISFTSLENYEGLVAYLWNYTSGFAEKQMAVEGQTATITLHNQTSGATLDFACKFAYAGGMSVTKRFQYTVPAYTGGGEEQGGGQQQIYWSDWMGDGAGDGLYSEKYKVQDVNGVNPVNIQKPGFATEAGIYINFPAAVTNVSISSNIDGAGIILHLSALTAEYTTVTVACADGQSFTFMVYYVDGTKSTTGFQPAVAAKKVLKTIKNGQLIFIRDGVRYNAAGQIL
mgnify:CR=1 FL=1